MPGGLYADLSAFYLLYVCYPVFCLSDNFLTSVCPSASVCMLVCLSSICLSFVCLSPVCHLLSMYQHVSVFMTLWVPVWLSVTCDILFPHLTFFTLFTLNQPLVFRSSLIVQPSLLALCIFCVFVSNTYHSPCFNCIASRTVTSELCSHPRILKIILGLCWAAPTVLLPGVCGIFPPLLPQDGTAEHTLPFLFSFPLTYSGFGVPNTFHIR